MAVDVNLLDGVRLFASLDDNERQLLAQALDLRRLAEGEALFEQGDVGDSLFVVREGAVELFVKDRAGQKIELSTAGPGDAFGELSMLDGRPRTASARAGADTVLLELDRDDFLPLVRRQPDIALDFMSAMSGMIRRADELLRARVARNANEEVETHSTPFERIADMIAEFSGSMAFLLLNGLWFLVWIVINTVPTGLPRFDPFPFGLLTMIVSLEAIFLSCFVLLSQNRQSAKDRVRSDIEYEVNVKAELEVAHLHDKIDRLQELLAERLPRPERRA